MLLYSLLFPGPGLTALLPAYGKQTRVLRVLVLRCDACVKGSACITSPTRSRFGCWYLMCVLNMIGRTPVACEYILKRPTHTLGIGLHRDVHSLPGVCM